METEINKDQTENRRLYWLIFFVSLVACVSLLYFKPEWFWLTLPFLFTYLVKAIGMM